MTLVPTTVNGTAAHMLTMTFDSSTRHHSTTFRRKPFIVSKLKALIFQRSSDAPKRPNIARENRFT